MQTEVLTGEALAPAAAPAGGQLQQVGAQALTAPASTTPGAMLIYAMERGADMAQIDKLLDLQMKWEANEARKAYVADMALFKQNPPTIIKDKAVGYEGRNGEFVGYKHATLGNVTNAIVEGLAKYGFSHRWDVKQDGQIINVTCRITHRLGHSEEVSMSSFKDDSGKKNAIQQVASAVTYLQRYTLLLATGLATHEQIDDDGAQAAEVEEPSIDWCAKANAAIDLKELEAIWHNGSAVIEGQEQYQQFKNACNARKAKLEANPAQPGRSSRVANIIGKRSQGDEAPQE
ncbi:MAG TPA: ERF family protein [Fluviicoccus sp.]|nr:ERF family protein [Fluviicoccus sp.]